MKFDSTFLQDLLSDNKFLYKIDDYFVQTAIIFVLNHRAMR